MKKFTIILLALLMIACIFTACTPWRVMRWFSVSSGNARFATQGNAATIYTTIASSGNAIASSGNAIASGGNAIASSGNAIASGGNAIASGGNATPANQSTPTHVLPIPTASVG